MTPNITATTRLVYCLAKKGQINAPGINASSKRAVEELVTRDAEEHHCYFHSAGFHNHLSHHLLAVYDLGGTAGHLKKIFDDEAEQQRPIMVDEEDKAFIVTDNNWIQYLGNASAYGAFFKYYSGKLQELGQSATLEKYVFDHSMNESGKDMLVRVMSAAAHPLINIGYGVEFGDDALVASGIASAATHEPSNPALFNLSFSELKPDGPGATVLEILRHVYDSEPLHPAMPYDPNALLSDQLDAFKAPERVAEIRRICNTFHIDPTAEELEAKVEEMIWVATLLLAATGKRDKPPRLDFFIMHLVTSSIFLKPLVEILENPASKANLLRSFLTMTIMLTLLIGRPRIDAELLMSYTATPRPPATSLQPSKSAIGSPLDDGDYIPWPAIFQDAVFHPDPHVVKTIRALSYGAREYGTMPAGGAPGSFIEGKESHPGTARMDGTIFVRAAGVVMDYMGWVANGQKARGDWDRTGLGWDAAWDEEPPLPDTDGRAWDKVKEVKEV